MKIVQQETRKNHNMKKIYATWRELNMKKEQTVKRVAGKKHTM